MNWITRERPKIDRIACPWLIKRFDDKDAEFIYLPSDIRTVLIAITTAAILFRFKKLQAPFTILAAALIGGLPLNFWHLIKRLQKSQFLFRICLICLHHSHP
jgi:hypothetical protein